ncbi:unnamed protein product [Pleuronectes platessa]|uniref:Uncharacterized protein n=1 Tax=Pleuronectes platessa TaxID=8262 RepID=A0A9N7V240_PLEPL|nr:unnamed protein product [Pleuronectes platessa]
MSELSARCSSESITPVEKKSFQFLSHEVDGTRGKVNSAVIKKTNQEIQKDLCEAETTCCGSANGLPLSLAPPGTPQSTVHVIQQDDGQTLHWNFTVIVI